MLQNGFVAALVLAGTVSLVLTGVGIRRWGSPRVRWFTVMMACITVWSIANAIRFSQTTLDAYLFWFKVSKVGMLPVPVLALLFVFAYIGYDHWAGWPRAGLLLAHPVALFVVYWVDSSLIWASVEPVSGPPVFRTEITYTALFHASYAYFYVLIAVGVILLLREFHRQHPLHQYQTGVVLVGLLVPVVGNLLWFVELSPVEHLDPSPFLLTVTGVAFGMSLFWYDLLDVVPVGRHDLVSVMRDGFVAVDYRGRVVDVNGAALSVLGVDSTDLVGEPASAVLPFDSGAVEDGAVGRKSANEFVTEVDGERRVFELRRSDVTSRRSRVAQLFIFRDVTDRYEVERRHSRLLEESSDLVTVFDENGTIDYVSPAVKHVLGYDREELQGTNVLSVTHPDDRERLRSQFETYLSPSGTELTVEHRLRHADGSWCLVESKARNLHHDPFVGGIVVNSRDMTARRERERRLERQNDRLEQFSGVVSHDLRNPLGVAQGYLELGRETGDDELFDEADSALDRMERLIDDLLTLSREGRSIDATATVEFATVVRQAWVNVDSGSVSLVVENGDLLLADESRLCELLENLFRNAVEHGDEEGIVRVRRTESGFIVEDDGPGIPESERDDVFDFGYTTAAGGTGFGLNIVQRIAEAHDWSVHVGESEWGGLRLSFDGATSSLSGESPASQNDD
ncbi:histidine kinase N-terminal 7TM domain-containing protein [Haloarchaeobius sp. DFWS5]|uniref:histidine kinase N-terminal 7TM domain-containing protein n=1 Tax=Haloarchaeobius sp. DFWS5 TaxID=3446114 RepID=UPI003EBC6E6A